MKYSKTAILLIILSSFILFAFGFLEFDKISDILLPKIEGGGYQVVEVNGTFKMGFFFSIVLALAPYLIHLTWVLSPITAVNKKLISILIVFTCMTLAIIVRREMIILYFAQFTKMPPSIINMPIDKVKYHYYLFAGLCIGCVISYFIFRKNNYKPHVSS